MTSFLPRAGTALALSTASIGLSCAGSVDIPGRQIEVSLATDKQSYGSDEPIALQLEITNRTGELATFEFSNGQRFDFVIQDEAGASVWRWSADKAFIQVLGEEQLAPGESLIYEERFEGSLQVGTYTVLGMLVASNEPLEVRITLVVSEA